MWGNLEWCTVLRYQSRLVVLVRAQKVSGYLGFNDCVAGDASLLLVKSVERINDEGRGREKEMICSVLVFSFLFASCFPLFPFFPTLDHITCIGNFRGESQNMAMACPAMPILSSAYCVFFSP